MTHTHMSYVSYIIMTRIRISYVSVSSVNLRLQYIVTTNAYIICQYMIMTHTRMSYVSTSSWHAYVYEILVYHQSTCDSSWLATQEIPTPFPRWRVTCIVRQQSSSCNCSLSRQARRCTQVTRQFFFFFLKCGVSYEWFIWYAYVCLDDIHMIKIHYTYD